MARLQGKTLGACHKCGASLKRGRSCLLRANHCVRCNTSYHTYDCGNRMAAVLLADNPAECPKVRGTSIFQRTKASSLLFRFLTQQTTFVSTQFAHKRHVTPSPVPTRGYTFSVATLVVARPDLSSATPTGTERGRQQSFRPEARVLPGTTPVNRKTTRHDETSNAPPSKERTCAVRLPDTHSLLSKPGLVRKLPFRFSNKLKPSPRCTPPLRSCRLRSRDTRVLRRLRKRNARPARHVEWLVW